MNSAVRLQEAAGCGERAIVLAQVDAICSEGGGESGKIVENEGNSGGAAKGEEAAGNAFDGGEVVVFRTKLEDVGSPGQEQGGDFHGTFFGRVAEVQDAVKAGGVEIGHRLR